MITVLPTYPYTIEFSDAEVNKINEALFTLEEAFAGKLVREHYVMNGQDADIENLGAIPLDDGTLITLAIPAYANISQWGKDEKACEQLTPIAARLKKIAQQVVHTNRAVLQRCWNSSGKY